jgi:DNA-binding LacI/PurR family transcriptional regulator
LEPVAKNMGKTGPKSIADIAKMAGVSKSTVSRALNDSPFANAETKDRIRAIAREHDFEPSAAARNLSLRSSRTIALVNHAYAKNSCSITDPFCLEITGGIAAGLHGLGYDLLEVIVDPDDKDWAGHYLDSGRVDGFILMTSTKKRDHVEMLIRKGAPFVAWGPAMGSYCTVCGDDLNGGKLATERLLSLGRKRIGFIGGPETEGEVQARRRGYQAALKDAGLVVDPALVSHGDYSEASGAKVMEALLKRAQGIDAVFCSSDMMAIAALRVILASGRRIPEDIAVVGYDNISLSAYVTPALTTVSQNIALAGRLLARDLVNYLEQGVVTTTVVPVELVVRASA